MSVPLASDNTELARRAPARGDARADGAAMDVSALPSFGFSHRSLMWWGTLGLMAIEGTVFALTVVSYFFLRSHVVVWPMNELPPRLLWGTLNTAVLLASLWPNHLAKQAAERLDRAGVQLWMSVCLASSLVFLIFRWFEFESLNCVWYDDAYASAVWLLLGLHTTHLITDTWDTGVLTALAFVGPFENKRFVDVSENALYWIFVVLSWLPIYAVIYWVPRQL